jgi:hypothetical protein
MEEIFHPPNLILSADVIPNYQLIRGMLAANATGGSFDRLIVLRSLNVTITLSLFIYGS